jgi:hypothetical protein
VAHLLRELEQGERDEPSLEEIVQAYRFATPAPSWEPVEAWQIVSVERLDAQEYARWGADGDQVVAWFDRGDLESWAAMNRWTDALTPSTRPQRRGWRRWVARLRDWIVAPQRWELAGAER